MKDEFSILLLAVKPESSLVVINVANLSDDFPLLVSEQEYEQLIRNKRNGWSNCDTQKEWMVKLHYLRTGFKEGKIGKEDFFKREEELVLNWWKKWCR